MEYLALESCSNVLKWKKRTSRIAKNDIFGPFEFAKIWLHTKLEWLWNYQISTKSSLNFTFWKFLEHSALVKKAHFWDQSTLAEGSLFWWKFCKITLACFSPYFHRKFFFPLSKKSLQIDFGKQSHARYTFWVIFSTSSNLTEW